MTQTAGPRTGFLWDPETMASLGGAVAMTRTMELIQQLLPYSAISCERVSPHFMESRCAMTISPEWLFKGVSLGPAGPLKRVIGTAMVPGSTRALNRQTGRLEDCTPTLCPHAVLERTYNGSEVLVNRLPVGPGLQHQLPIIEEEADDGGGGSDHGSYGHGAGDGDDDDDGAGSDGGAGSAGGAMAVIAAAAAAAAAGPSDEHAARHKRALRTDRQTQRRMLQLDVERRALEGRRELKAAAAVGEAALLAALLADERMLDASQTTGRKRGGGEEELDAPLDTPVGLSQPEPRRGEAAPEAAEDGEEGRRVARRTTGGEEGDAAVPAAAPAVAGGGAGAEDAAGGGGAGGAGAGGGGGQTQALATTGGAAGRGDDGGDWVRGKVHAFAYARGGPCIGPVDNPGIRSGLTDAIHCGKFLTATAAEEWIMNILHGHPVQSPDPKKQGGPQGWPMEHGTKLVDLMRVWARDRRLDVVCLQEVHIAADDVASMDGVDRYASSCAYHLGTESYTFFWGGGAGTSAGIAILVRSDLLASLKPVQADGDGRLMVMDITWGGGGAGGGGGGAGGGGAGRLRLVNAYLPASQSNRPAVQAAFIEEQIRPLAAGQTHLVLAGDFNFVESPRDRARSEGPLEWRDRTPAAAMAALVEDSPLRDAYRLIHPMQRGYTFSAYNAQARLDRLYVSMALVPRVLGCDAGESGGSDHRVVAMHLSPLVPESRGPGRPRVRAHFWADRDLADGFRAWFGREAAGAPTHGHTELMRWWQAFKPRLAREARRLDCDLGRRRDAVSVEVTRLRADLQRARAAVEAGRDGLAELAGLYALQRRLDAAVRRYAPAPPACVRPGERVSGGMAAAFRKPAAARRVAALRDARGILVTDGRGMADIMADAVAAVSRPPPPSPADREAVLGAVRAHSPRVPQAVADAAGALVVTPAEVRAAATHSKPGTAPGPDGIPVDVWRKLGEPAFELLAAVFTAVGAAGGTPPGFLDGVVASIYKAKNAADAANYRPLTMLGSDYRILAKVLATRWTPLLSAVVGPEQTAFLAGRRISDNICLTQMLPGLLAANAAEGVGPTGAALALLDFRKAYDTIDRGFLIAVMEAVGVGDGVLAWTRTILTHTYASAEVNGFISAPRKYAAGVRQGCPAAPALFLFLGHALACFLRTCPAVGVEVVPGCRVTCPQYADDCMPLLRSCAPADVAALVETMAVFGRATGLVLNLGKCGILPLGSAGEGLLAGAEVAGLRVLDAGVSLGVPVSAGLPPPEGVTGVCRERLAAAYTKLARFPMSAFGRGHAAATYGVSRILFRAVHCGMTPEAERVLSRWTATLVDRSVGPNPPAELPRWASSVPAELWGAEAPLWANPLLQLELPAAQRSVQWREPTGDAAGHALFSPTDAARWLVDGLARVRDALPGMRTVTDLCVLWAWLAAVDMVFAGLRGLEAAVPTLWRMPLLNARKEPIWRLWPPARSVAVERAGELATMDLWDALASFAEGGGMPRGWAGVVGPTHPFVGVVDGGLTLNKTS
ncbi:hypothetical protein FOA52_007354 [Chlamydomonas sp. UWO 241]|nr:hypothetical protein FOA52_007354 [Chlamydomonas sp. UWO 241]